MDDELHEFFFFFLVFDFEEIKTLENARSPQIFFWNDQRKMNLSLPDAR